MKIITEVKVKQIITVKSKQKIIENLSNNMKQLNKECDQLQFEWKRLEKKYKRYEQKVDERFEKEMERRKEKLAILQFQFEQIQSLPFGSEIEVGTIEALEEIKVGDLFTGLKKGKEIVIKDDVIVEIREMR
ncbi:MAG TPA: YlqD family protein [Massilibacterium sp.]|nr:YlqD family protein [Massilibacterium sp.]